MADFENVSLISWLMSNISETERRIFLIFTYDLCSIIQGPDETNLGSVAFFLTQKFDVQSREENRMQLRNTLKEDEYEWTS